MRAALALQVTGVSSRTLKRQRKYLVKSLLITWFILQTAKLNYSGSSLTCEGRGQYQRMMTHFSFTGSFNQFFLSNVYGLTERLYDDVLQKMKYVNMSI